MSTHILVLVIGKIFEIAIGWLLPKRRDACDLIIAEIKRAKTPQDLERIKKMIEGMEKK